MSPPTTRPLCVSRERHSAVTMITKKAFRVTGEAFVAQQLLRSKTFGKHTPVVCLAGHPCGLFSRTLCSFGAELSSCLCHIFFFSCFVFIICSNVWFFSSLNFNCTVNYFPVFVWRDGMKYSFLKWKTMWSVFVCSCFQVWLVLAWWYLQTCSFMRLKCVFVVVCRVMYNVAKRRLHK